MNKKLAKKQGVALLNIMIMILLAMPISFAIVNIDSVIFENPSGVNSTQNIVASITSDNEINSAKIEILEINHSMSLISNMYVYSFVPPSIENISFKIFAADNETASVFAGSFEVKDLTAPKIISSTPSGVSSNITQVISVTTDENAECKFNENDLDYSLMAYTFDGTSTIHTFTLQSLSEGVKNYYVRCKDNNNNINSNSYLINFKIDKTPPQIISKDPINNINSETYTISVATDESSECKYDETNNTYTGFSRFFNGQNLTHTSQLTHLSSGKKSYFIACKDNAGNIIYDTLNFTVNLAATAQITISKNSPLSADTYKITVITSKPLSSNPKLQYIYDDEQRYYEISLIGADNMWTGYLVITPEPKDRVGTFKFSGTDYDGLVGNKITSGSMYVVDTTKPIAPSSIEAEIKNNRIEISWFYNGEEADHFKIYRADVSGIEYVDYYDKKDKSPFKDLDIDEGKTYYYRVAAIDKAGNVGDLSSEVHITYIDTNQSNNYNSGNVNIEKLSSPLEQRLNATYSKIKTLKFDIDYANAALNRETDRFKNTIISELKLIENSNTAKIITENLFAELDALRTQDLDESEFNSRLEKIDEKFDNIRNDVIMNIKIIDSLEFSPIAQEKDINSGINEMLLQNSLDDDLKTNFTKSAVSMQDSINVFATIISANIKSLDGEEKNVIIVVKEISSSDTNYNVILYEDIPKTFAESAKDIIFSEAPKILKDDPIVYWNSPKLENKKISYYVFSKKEISDAKESKTLIFPDPIKLIPKKGVYNKDGSTPPGLNNQVTGNSIFSSIKIKNFKEYLFFSIGIFMISGLLVYYFFFINDSGKEQNGYNDNKEYTNNKYNNYGNENTNYGNNINYTGSNTKLDSVISVDSLEEKHLRNLIDHAEIHANNLNFEQASKEYALIYSIFSSVNLENTSKKAAFALKIHSLHKKITSKQKIAKAHNDFSNKEFLALKQTLDELKLTQNLFSKEEKAPLKNYINEYYDYYSTLLPKNDEGKGEVK